jgi:hypothetical protein
MLHVHFEPSGVDRRRIRCNGPHEGLRDDRNDARDHAGENDNGQDEVGDTIT